MNSQDIKTYYLAKITEAEHKAASAEDAAAREQWYRIIDGYRSLAGLPLLGDPR